MSKNTMYYIGDLEVWFNEKRLEKMEMGQAEESYIRSLFETGHILKDMNGRHGLVDEIIHPANRV